MSGKDYRPIDRSLWMFYGAVLAPALSLGWVYLGSGRKADTENRSKSELSKTGLVN